MRCCPTTFIGPLLTYHRPAAYVWVLLIKVLLKLGELVQVPVFLSQPFAGVAKPSSSSAATTSAVSTKASTTAITVK